MAGFFQKAVVEIEAQPGGAAAPDGRRAGNVAARRRRPDRARAEPAPVQIAPGAGPRRRGRRLRRRPGHRRAHAPPRPPPQSRPRPPTRPAAPARRCAPWTPSRTRATPRPRSCRSSPCPRPPLVAGRPSRVGRSRPAPLGHGPRGAARPSPRPTASRRPCAAPGLSEAFSAAVLDEATVHGLPFTERGPQPPCARSWLAPWRAGSPSPRSAAPARSPSSAPAGRARPPSSRGWPSPTPPPGACPSRSSPCAPRTAAPSSPACSPRPACRCGPPTTSRARPPASPTCAAARSCSSTPRRCPRR